jgi:hypothetical protein
MDMDLERWSCHTWILVARKETYREHKSSGSYNANQKKEQKKNRKLRLIALDPLVVSTGGRSAGFDSEF